MTISHPSNVKNVLASGVDSLVISMNVSWKDTSIFAMLDEIKNKAIERGDDYPGEINHIKPDKAWPFNVKPYGTKGYSWILTGCDFAFTIANSQEPGSRPNAMATIRSETLWRLGPEEATNIALGLITANGGHRIEAKLSRVDLCADFIMPEKLWSQSLMARAVTRATDFSPYYRHMRLTGIRIGKGTISARLYDKPLEIKQQSGKKWMFDIWGIEEPPEGTKIIRIEFQLRREVLKELGLKGVADLLPKIDGAWAYCTKKWLKFQDRPDLHHTQQSTLKWYQEIQNGFKGVQGAEPLIREKAVSMDKTRLMQQANGLIKSIHAIDQEEKREDREKPVSIDDCLDSYKNELRKHPESPSEIKANVTKKRARYHRQEPRIVEGQTLYRLRRNEKVC